MIRRKTREQPCICKIPDGAFVAIQPVQNCTCEPDETTGNTEFETGILSCNICGGFVKNKGCEDDRD